MTFKAYRYLLLMLSVAAVAVSAVCGYWQSRKRSNWNPEAPAVVKLERLAYLVPLKVMGTNVVVAEDKNWFGDIRTCWLTKGDALVVVDLERAKVLSREDQGKTIRLSLPAPQIRHPRVDFEASKQLDLRATWLRSSSSDDAYRVVQLALKEAREAIERTASEDVYIRASKARTERILRAIYTQLGWHVSIEWEVQK